MIKEMYVIIGEYGSHEDHYRWEHSVWFNESKAIFFATEMQKACENKIKEIKESSTYKDDRDKTNALGKYMAEKWRDIEFAPFFYFGRHWNDELATYHVIRLEILDDVVKGELNEI